MPVAYQCWVLPMSISGASKSITFCGFHCVILFFLMFEGTLWSGLPVLSTHLKNPTNKLSTFQKNQKTPLHLHLSNHTGFVGTFLTAIAETLDSAPEEQKLLSLAPRSNQIGVYFIASINFLLTVLEVCKEERREREEKSCSGMQTGQSAHN